MAKKKDRKGLLVLLGLGGGLVAWAVGKKPSGYGANISLQILDAATGEPVPHDSPATVVDGGSYIARATVTNRSTRLGTPVAATLTIKFYGFAGGFPDLIWPVPEQKVQTFNFAAGQSGEINCSFKVPAGTAGQVGEIGAWVESPNAVELARGREPLTIITTVYAASLALTFPVTGPVVEGGTYTARVSITNQSSLGGVPVPATPTLPTRSQVGEVILLDESSPIGLLAGETKTFDYFIPVPDGTAGLLVWVESEALSPNNIQLAYRQVSVQVQSAAIAYGATIQPIQVL